MKKANKMEQFRFLQEHYARHKYSLNEYVCWLCKYISSKNKSPLKENVWGGEKATLMNLNGFTLS